MRPKLTLVPAKPEASDKIIASIRPLARDVVPSDHFRRQMKLRLLNLAPPAPGNAQAA